MLAPNQRLRCFVYGGYINRQYVVFAAIWWKKSKLQTMQQDNVFAYFLVIIFACLHCCIISVLTIFPHQDGVTIGLEVLLPKDARLHSDTSPPVQYDVFLYKVGGNGDSASPNKALPSRSATYCPSSHPAPKSPKTPKSPKVSKSPKHTKEHPPSDHEPLPSSPGRHPSPTRHSAPGCYSAPTSHPSAHHSPSRHQCMPAASTPPQLRRPRGRSQAPASDCCSAGRECQSGYIHPSPSSPHLTQPPPSPSRLKSSTVSTRSLPPLSWPGLHPTHNTSAHRGSNSFISHL